MFFQCGKLPGDVKILGMLTINLGRATRLLLALAAPLLAAAQGPQTPSPAQKPSPATIAPSGRTAQTRTQSTAPGQQFIMVEDLFRPRPKPAGAPAAAVQTKAPQIAPVQPRVVAQPVAQPTAAAAVPVSPNPLPAAEPVINTSPSASGLAAVEYAHGQLTVVSDKASLGVVLKLVANRTGAVIDLSPELQNEPVIAKLGPAPTSEVLTALLDSPKVDYIVMGTGDATGTLQRIVVRTRQAFSRTAMAAIHRPQSQPAPDAEARLDANGHLAGAPVSADSKLAQEQLMENWKKAREEMRLAEIQQQAQDRENEKTQPQIEPQVEAQPETPTEPPQPDNPPQR
jgi:hypothetical protein